MEKTRIEEYVYNCGTYGRKLTKEEAEKELTEIDVGVEEVLSEVVSGEVVKGVEVEEKTKSGLILEFCKKNGIGYINIKLGGEIEHE